MIDIFCRFFIIHSLYCIALSIASINIPFLILNGCLFWLVTHYYKFKFFFNNNKKIGELAISYKNQLAKHMNLDPNAIEVHVNRNLRDLFGAHAASATFDYTSYKVKIELNGFTFSGKIDERQDFTRLYGSTPVTYNLKESVAHEMVHARQILSGELVFDFQNKRILWKGEDCTFIKLAACTQESYEALPWEAEAFGEMKELAKILDE